MTGSISFDRAAPYYDATRTTDKQSLTTILDALQVELVRDGPILELGVGTGQLAIPLATRGAPVVGLDLSAEMLAVLREKEGGEVPLIRGDATRLPVATGSLAGAYARWVLHLIADWRDVLRELDRTVAPGGSVAIEPGGFTGRFREVYLRYRELLGDAVVPVGLSAIDRDDELDEGFAKIGWSLRRAVPVRYERAATLREAFDKIPSKQWSWTWGVPDRSLAEATDEVRAWAAERYDLDQPVGADPTSLRVYGRAA